MASAPLLASDPPSDGVPDDTMAMAAADPRVRRMLAVAGLDPERWRLSPDPTRCYIEDRRCFAKIQLAAPASGWTRRLDLVGETRILARCAGVPGVPRVVSAERAGCAQLLVMERIEGTPLSTIEVGWLALLRIAVRVAGIVWRLAACGVSHNDLRPANVLVARNGRVFIVDFDQASRRSRLACLLADGLGLSLGSAIVHNSIFALMREKLQASLPPGAIRFVRNARLRRVAEQTHDLPPLPANASRPLALLHEAWALAARADASAPGQPIAYYALEHDGFRLPGERDWTERWRDLERVTALRGRRVLELGCNKALLSMFALRAGARAALAVDHDPLILEAAARVARAFDVEPELRRVDFDRDPDWEVELAAFRPDVVFALSVLEWVQDKARLLAFLARCDEVVFEGHHSARFERRRLCRAGFTAVELVATSERGRPVLLCRR